MTTREENNTTIITADEGKTLYCSYLNREMGKEVYLGYVYYDKDNNLLEKPYKLTTRNFKEIDEVITSLEGFTPTEPELKIK